MITAEQEKEQMRRAIQRRGAEHAQGACAHGEEWKGWIFCDCAVAKSLRLEYEQFIRRYYPDHHTILRGDEGGATCPGK